MDFERPVGGRVETVGSAASTRKRSQRHLAASRVEFLDPHYGIRLRRITLRPLLAADFSMLEGGGLEPILVAG